MNEQELIKAMNALREAITRSSATASAAQRKAGTRATAIAGASDDAARASKKAVNALDREVERASRVISSLRKSATKARDAVTEVESAGKKLKGVTADLASAVSGVSAALRSVSRSFTTIFSKLEDQFKAVSVQVPGVDLKATDASIARLTATLLKVDGQLLAGTTRIVKRLDDMGEAVGATTTALEQAMAKAQAHRPTIDMGAITASNKALLGLTSTSKGLDRALAELSHRVNTSQVLPGKEADGLKASVRKVRGALYGLADHIAKLTSVTPQGSEFLDAAAESAADRVDKLAYTTNRLRASFIDVIKVLRDFARTGLPTAAAQVSAAPTTSTSGPPAPPPTTPPVAAPAATPPPGKGFMAALQAAIPPTSGALGKLTSSLGSTSGASTLLTSTLTSLARVGGVLADQYLAVSRMGYDASFGSLVMLNKQSILLGRSFNETMKFMEDNAVLLSRSRDFESFFKEVSHARTQLGRLGATAREAQDATAQMEVAAIVAGVPLSQAGGAVDALIPTFEALQKQVGMTAGAFANLTTIAASNENVQRDLYGLNKEDRAERFKETVQMLSNVAALKGNTDATKALQQELLASRTTKVKSRFEQIGRVRQLGMQTGQGVEAEELSRLLMKNPRTLTADEELRKSELAGKLQIGLDTMARSGNISTEAIANAHAENLDKSGIGGLMKKGAAVFQTAGGEGLGDQNKQFGKHVGTFGMIIQDLKGFVDGVTKNMSLLGPLTTAVTGIAGLLLMMKANSTLGTLASNLPGAGPTIGQGPPGPGGKPPPASGKVPGKPGVLARGVQAVGGAMKTVGGGFVGKLSGAVNATLDPLAKGAASVKAMATGGAALGGAGGIASSVASGIGKFLGGLSKVTFWLSPIMGAIEEIFTGNLAQMFGEDGSIMGRVQGVVFGALRAIVTSFTGIFDSVLGWFGVDLNITGWFDRIIAVIFKQLNEGKAAVWSALGFDSWAKEAKDLAKKWDSVGDKIASGEAKTLTDVGAGIQKETEARKKAEDENKKAAAKHAESITKLSTVATNAMDVEKTARAVSAARAQQAIATPKQPGAMATPTPDVKPSVAVPVAEPVRTVNPPTVNKPVAKAVEQQPPSAEQQSKTVAPADALLVLTQKIVEVLQQSYQAENRQGELLAQLLVALGRTPAPFVPRVEDGVYGIVKR